MMNQEKLDPPKHINIILNPDEMKVDQPNRISFLKGIWKAVRHDACTIIISQVDLSKDVEKNLAEKLPIVPINKGMTA